MSDFTAILISLMILLGVAWLLLRFLAAGTGTLAHVFSGEAGNILARGFGTKSARYRRTADLERAIGTISLAVRQNLPLLETLNAAIPGESKPVQRMLGSVAARLQIGRTLSEAVRWGLPGCPVVFVEMIRDAEHAGRVAEALSEIEEMLAARLFNGPAETQPAYVFGALTVLSGIWILGGVMYWIIPKFREIFEDFDTPLPQATTTLISLAYGVWVIAIPLLLAVALGGVFLIVGSGRNRDGRPRFAAELIGLLRSLVPGIRTIDRGLGMAVVIRRIALHVRSGAPLDKLPAIETALRPTNALNGAVRAFVEDLRRGSAPHEAASRAGLGSVYTAAWRGVERGEDPGPLFEHAAAYHEALGERWMEALGAVTAPFVTLLVACFVGFAAYALFIPLVALINGITESMS